MKKKFFGITFDPRMQPGYVGRFRPGPDVPGQITGTYEEPVNLGVKESDLCEKMALPKFLNSGQVDKLLPSRILRRKGK